MNNNRNQNNRRRGRGNRNQGGGGGGNQGNRIDSRARGNAPQLLEKYKKLAQDAQHNGDRVQAEYYLQFADHYFRVIADNRTRQDEQRGDQRPGRRDEREQEDYDAEDEGAGEMGGEDRRRFETREPREPRRERPRRDFRRDEPFEDAGVVEASEGPAFEPEDNPFTREVREPRETREAGGGREERPRRRAPRARRGEEESVGIDAAVLPPSLSANDGGESGAEGEPAVPRPRRRRSEGGTLSAVG